MTHEREKKRTGEESRIRIIKNEKKSESFSNAFYLSIAIYSIHLHVTSIVKLSYWYNISSLSYVPSSRLGGEVVIPVLVISLLKLNPRIFYDPTQARSNKLSLVSYVMLATSPFILSSYPLDLLDHDLEHSLQEMDGKARQGSHGRPTEAAP